MLAVCYVLLLNSRGRGAKKKRETGTTFKCRAMELYMPMFKLKLGTFDGNSVAI